MFVFNVFCLINVCIKCFLSEHCLYKNYLSDQMMSYKWRALSKEVTNVGLNNSIIKGGQQSQLLYVKGPIKQPPVDPRPQNFTWRAQMGLGVQEKKVKAIWPLTSDFLILASI